jgi:hypothetical protein
MTDSHMRLLAAVARHRERERDEYDSSTAPFPLRQAVRRADLTHRATRARKQVSAAQARRRLVSHESYES